MFVTIGSGVLSVDSSGTDVVLTRFPDAGKDLTAFGLSPSKIKTIALPNDLQAWPASALKGCTALEKITVYGDEVDGGTILINRNQGLFDLAALTSISFPSTVTRIDCSGGIDASTFHPNIQSVFFSGKIVTVNRGFYGTSLKFVNWSSCTKLQRIGWNAFRGAEKLSSLDLSECSHLTEIAHAAFYFCNQLKCVIFPPSLRTIESVAFQGGETASGQGAGTVPSPVRTVIWKGRADRSNVDIDAAAFYGTKTLDTLVEEGTIQEIFIP